MPWINTKVVSHHLAIYPSVKPLTQRKWKVGKEKRVIIDEDIGKLSDTNMNIIYHKDPYSLPDINLLLNRSSGYRMLSFMNA